MLNPITLVIERPSGPLEVTSSGLDYEAYEDTFDRSALLDLSNGRYKFYCFIVWHAMHRQGLTDQTFEQFVASSPVFGQPKVEEVVPLESPAPTGS